MEDSPSDTGYRTGNLLLIETVDGQVCVTGVLIAHFFGWSWPTTMRIEKREKETVQLPSSDYEALACGGQWSRRVWC
ncbi:hypothetical protein N7528_002918 [Penicillium herquei]|nr:hypothetical protein N7528_002918 [Penicillium herquei]